MVLRRTKRDGGDAARIELDVEVGDPLSGAPAGTEAAATVSFPPPAPGGEVRGGPAATPARRIAVPPGEYDTRGRASRMFPVRIVLVSVMGVVLAVLGGRAFDERVPELLIAPVAVGAAALVARRWRWWLRAPAAAVVVAGSTAATGLIADVAVGDLLDELVDGPRRLLTTEWPSPLDPGVVMAVSLAVALVTAVAADLAGRPRFHVAPLGAVAIGFTAALAIAAPVRSESVPVAVLAVAAVLLLLARPGDDPRARFRLVLAERSMLGTIMGLVLAGVVTAGVIALDDRADPRQDVQAELALSLLDPVEQMVALRKAEPRIVLFEIADRSELIGPSLPTRWRLSALDQYDGQRWFPAATLRPIGSRLGLPTPPTAELAPPIRYDLTIQTDDMVLIPLPGRPLEFEADDGAVIETDEQRTVVRLAEAPEPGMQATVTAEVAPTEAAVADAVVARRQIDEIATTFGDRAGELAGEEGTIIERLREIESVMRNEWSLDDNASGGQQLTLIQIFVNDTTRGTREQFATAFALLARSLGVDARVATGLVVPPSDLDSPLTLTSEYADVWPEVRIEGIGWLAFDPVPAEQASDDEERPSPPSQQSPAAAQPPPADPPERSDEPVDPTDETEESTVGLGSIWLARAAIIGGAMVLPLVIAIGTILVLKWRRRRRRLAAADPAQRILGAWANTTDSLVDAGLVIRPAWTDDRIAEQATTVAPTIPHDMRRLASAATAMTFGRTERSRFLVDDAITTSRSVDQAIRSERSRWQRLRWRLSTRSLRKKTRSPVVA